MLKECERIRALMAREEAALANGEHDDGIPIAAAPPELTRPVGLLLAHSTKAIHPSAWKGYSRNFALTGFSDPRTDML